MYKYYRGNGAQPGRDHLLWARGGVRGAYPRQFYRHGQRRLKEVEEIGTQVVLTGMYILPP